MRIPGLGETQSIADNGLEGMDHNFLTGNVENLRSEEHTSELQSQD